MAESIVVSGLAWFPRTRCNVRTLRLVIAQPDALEVVSRKHFLFLTSKVHSAGRHQSL